MSNPLDTAKFQKAPCSLLSKTKLKQLQSSITLATTAKPKAAQVDTTGPACDWNGDDPTTQSSVSLTLLTAGQGLSSLYWQKKDYAVFKPVGLIDGYPSVIAMTTDGQPSGRCSMVVGVSDKLGLEVDMNTNDKKSCTSAQQVAKAAVATIKGGGS